MSVTLGIDIGTTKVAAVIYDTEQRNILSCASKNTQADLDRGEWLSEQSVDKIFQALDEVMNSLETDHKKKVSAIGVTGQMHGVVLWNENETSSLITWKDRRASGHKLIAEINRVSGAEQLKDGFGITSMACLARENKLQNWTCAATIHDYLVYRICGLARPVMDPGNAASWGCFDVYNRGWDMKAIKELNIPETLLPEIVPSGAKAGCFDADYAEKWDIPEGVPVTAALGDNQASILLSSDCPENEIYLTLGTGAQLTVVVDKEDLLELEMTPAMEIRPYVEGRYIAVAAPLCGGQAFAWLADTVQCWLKELGLPELPEYELFRKLDALGVNGDSASLDVKPNFIGERHAPELTGSIDKISLDSFSLSNLAASLARGIVANMKNMISPGLLVDKKCVIGSGNAVRRLNAIQKMIEQEFNLPLVVKESKEEAACGAAILSAKVE